MVGQHLANGLAPHVGDNPPAFGSPRWSRGSSSAHTRRAAAHRPSPQSPLADAYRAASAASAGDRRSAPPGRRARDSASRRAGLPAGTSPRPRRHRRASTARGATRGSDPLPGARRYRAPVARLIGEEPAIRGTQVEAGKRGRVDEGFIHSVRSQLPIRGKHSDHRAAVEALALPERKTCMASLDTGANHLGSDLSEL